MSKLYKNLLSLLEEKLGFFTTFHKRPVRSKDCKFFLNKPFFKNRFFIVIQGPVITDHDFTLETVRIYKKTFPDADIVLSTWDDSDLTYIEKIKAEKISILLNSKPVNFGISNINLQIVSSLAGVRYAKQSGAEYVLKTRTDQRMYASNVQDFLVNIVNNFPVHNNNKQTKRIVAVSLNTFMFRPYSLSDMNIFGHVDDMLLFWDVQLDDRKKTDTKVSLLEWSKLRLCEVYLVSNFLEKIGCKLTWTLTDYWRVLSDNFCIVDQSSIDLYWYKYERFKERRHVDYKVVKTDSEVYFKDWLYLYNCNKNDIVAPEDVTSYNFNEEYYVK